MTEKSAVIPGPPRRRKRGRPSRQEATARALAALAIDPRTVDPLAVLAGIMVDISLPAAARVQAARALIAARDPDGPDKSAADAQAVDAGAISVRALQLLKAGRGH